MVLEMQRLNPLSVLQVSGKLELEKALSELFTDVAVLEAHRMAAKEGSHHLSSDIVTNVWSLLNFHIFSRDGKQRLVRGMILIIVYEKMMFGQLIVTTDSRPKSRHLLNPSKL